MPAAGYGLWPASKANYRSPASAKLQRHTLSPTGMQIVLLNNLVDRIIAVITSPLANRSSVAIAYTWKEKILP